MSLDSKQLKQQRSKLLTDMQNLAMAGFNTESRTAFDKMAKDASQLDSDIERVESLEQRSSHLASFTPSPRPNPSGSASLSGPHDVEQRKKSFNAAFRQYARHGYGGLNEEQRALLTTSDTTGGAFIPQMFEGVLHEARKYYGAIATKVSQRVTNNNGAPIKISLTNDVANGLTLLATEGTSSPVETDPAMQSKLLGADTVTGGLVKVSFQEIDDSAFDLDAFIRKSFAKRYARGLETAVTLGTDSAGTALPNFSSGGLLGMATTGVTQVAGTLSSGIGWTDIVNTFGALDAAYLGPNTAWVFNTNTRTMLLSMKDGFGRPFWIPDPSGDGPFSKLLGYDVVLNQAMPNAGTASATPIIFGDLEESYVLRTDGQPSILRLNERYADQLEVGFFLYTRIGGTSLDAGTHPLVKLTQAAS